MYKSILSKDLDLKNGIKIKNRFFKSAMSEQLGDKNHNPKKELAVAYSKWADGEVGLSVSGNIMITRDALGEPSNIVLDEKSNIDMFKVWTDGATKNKTHFWAQLNHPGKQSPSFLSKTPVAPSAVPLENDGFNTPRELTEIEILELIESFATSAYLAKKAGFTGVQIHAAHGYLVSQFLSPKHNIRNDRWGGTIDNRMRFLLEIYTAMRRRVGESFPIGVKLNSADFMKGGFSEDDSTEVVKKLSSIGIDLIEISGGTYENPVMVSGKESTKKREAYFMEYAEKVRELISTPLVVTGGFRSSKGMSDAVESGKIDMVGIGRPLTLDPNLPIKAMSDEFYSIDIKDPTTGIKSIDKMFMLGITWYEQQIINLGKGLEPNSNMSAWKSIINTLINLGIHSFRKRRS